MVLVARVKQNAQSSKCFIVIFGPMVRIINLHSLSDTEDEVVAVIMYLRPGSSENKYPLCQ